jgi:hypothetical protein
LDEAATKDDVKVFVGVGQCNVTSVSSENIYCTPPTSQPRLRDDGKQRADGIPRVFVRLFSVLSNINTLLVATNW